MRGLLTTSDREHAAGLVEITRQAEGATFVFDRVGTRQGPYLGAVDSPTYVVGGVVEPLVVPLAAFGSNDVLRQLQAARAAGAAGVGTWIYEGNVHIDAVDILTDEQEALDVARSRGEIAIWDAYLAHEITVKYDEPEPVVIVVLDGPETVRAVVLDEPEPGWERRTVGRDLGGLI